MKLSPGEYLGSYWASKLCYIQEIISMTRLLIVGATGELGRAATKYLLRNNCSVKAFVRNKNNSEELKKAGADIFLGDITNPDSVKEACTEIDVVIAAVHGMLGTGKNKSQNVDDLGHKILIDCSIESKVKHFIFPSIFGVTKNHPIDFFRTKYETEQYLINSGLTYTILRLAPFMEWHVHNLLGKSIQEKGKTTILGVGDNPTNFIAVADIVQVLKIIIENDVYSNKTLNIGGPENISRNEIANLYAAVLKIPPRINHIPIRVLKILSGLIRPFHAGIGRVMTLSAYNDKADATMHDSQSIRQFGLTPTTIEEFINLRLRSNALS